MDLWVREARIFKYGSGTGSNFSSLRGDGEPLSGGGKSSGLMSFLKIGDRAAGAIKKPAGRRAALRRWSCWTWTTRTSKTSSPGRSTEEQKVASLVTGSKLLNKHLNAVLKSIVTHPDPEAQYDPAKNAALPQGGAGRPRRARPRELDRAGHPARPPGRDARRLRGVRHRLDLEGVLHRQRPEQQQQCAHPQRLHGRGRERRPVAPLLAHRTRQGRSRGPRPQAQENAAGPPPVGPDRRERLGLRRPRRAVRHDDQRVAHLPRRRPHQRQ